MWGEVEAAGLPDRRLTKRLGKLVERLSQFPERSLPQVFGGWKETKAAYRFLDNERVSHAALMMGQRDETRQRIIDRGESTVLMVQDTTGFDFKHHPATDEMGPLENEHMNGFLAHSTLAVSADGVPLGLWEQQVWVRNPEETGKRHQRHQKAFEEKESYKWVRGLPEGGSLLKQQVITVCDREAHIYEFLDEAHSRSAQFIVRASRGRGHNLEGQDVFEVVGEWPVQQGYKLLLKRHPDRQPREAMLELRFGTLTLARPRRSQASHETLQVQVVEAREVNPPPGEKGVHWLLLTSLPVDSLAQAHQIVQWYTFRWLVERFHYVLKSGCRLEERQLQTRPRLERLLGVFNLVSWNLLWLTYQTRLTPDMPCVVALDEVQWQALYAFTHHTFQLPSTPPTLHEAVRWIAQLGGFLGRTGDGEPGVKVLWRGWQRLQDIVTAWRILYPSHPLCG